MNTATVIARVWDATGSILLATEESQMSQDLPADCLGELVYSAIHTAWKAGNDPTKFHVVIHFS